MSNYSDSPNSCRVDFFRESGKWYETEVIIFRDSDYKAPIHEAFANALRDSIASRYLGMTAVCLKPYHQHSHPITLKDW